MQAPGGPRNPQETPGSPGKYQETPGTPRVGSGMIGSRGVGGVMWGEVSSGLPAVGPSLGRGGFPSPPRAMWNSFPW